jgi:hypothetical protein
LHQARLIVYHKQNTSARTRFLRYQHGGVCGLESLPALAEFIDDSSPAIPRPELVEHPAALVSEAAALLGLSRGDIVVEPEFHEWVDIPDGPVRVFLGRCDSIDPPLAGAEDAGCRFVDLTEARDLPPAELELLRRAYTVVMEG